MAGTALGISLLGYLAQAVHRQHDPGAYRSAQDFAQAAETAAAAQDWPSMLVLLTCALDPNTAPPFFMSAGLVATALPELVAAARWDLATALCKRVRLPRPLAVAVARQWVAAGGPAPLDPVLQAMDTRGPARALDPALLLPWVDVMAAHCSAEWLQGRAQAGWFPAALVQARQAGTVAASDCAWLWAVHQLDSDTEWQDGRWRSMAGAALAHGNADMLRALHALARVHARGAAQAAPIIRGWAAVPAHRQAAVVAAAAAFASSPYSPRHAAQVNEALGAAGSAAPHVQAAVLRQAFAQWLTGDAPGAMQRVAQLQLQTPLQFNTAHLRAVLAHAPEQAAAMACWCVARPAHAAALQVLIFALPAAALPTVLEALTQRRASGSVPRLNLGAAWFEPGLLRISALSAAHQETVAALAQPGAAPACWDADFVLSQAFNSVVRRAPHAAAPLLAALRVCQHMPQFARALDAMLRYELTASLALAGDASLSPRGLLLGLQALAAGGPQLLQQPGCQQLLRSRYVLKDETRYRQALGGFADFTARVPTRRVAALQALLNWPAPPALRAQLTDAATTAWTAYATRLAELEAGTLAVATVRLARDRAEQAGGLLLLHAQHMHAQAHGPEVLAHQAALAAHERVLYVHGAALGLLLERHDPAAAQALANLVHDSSTPALQRAHKLFGARAHAARQAGALVVRECVEQGRVWLASLLQLRRCQSQLAAPWPHSPAPLNFFARPEQRQSLATLHHRVIDTQLDALSWMADLLQLRCSLAFDTPQDLHDRLLRNLDLPAHLAQPLPALLQTFRRPRLFWAYARRVSMAGGPYQAAAQQVLQARLQSTAHYHALRRISPQMQALFSGHPERANLQSAWEAGAQRSAAAAVPVLQGLSLIDTGDFTDFVSSADEVSGSCQSVLTGDFGHLLLGRMVDGSKRMLALKDANGALKARAMLRLMLTPQGAPALLLSALYTANVPVPQASAALIAWAQQRAQALGLPLYGVGFMAPHGVPTRQVLLSHVGTVGEYWDELRAPQLRGTVRLTDVRLIQPCRANCAPDCSAAHLAAYCGR